MSTAPPVDVGLTDVLDPVLGDRLRAALDHIDARAGARVDGDGVHVRRLLRTVHVPWDRVDRVRLDSRLDLLLTFAVGLLPVTRLPVVGAAIESATDRVVEQLALHLAPGLRDRAGWAVATIEQQTWRRDVDFQRTARAVVLLYPAVTHRLVEEADSRGIPVIRDDGAPSRPRRHHVPDIPDDIRTALVRADDLLKAAPNRPEPEAALAQAADILERARERVAELADGEARQALATQIARRMGDIDAATFTAVEPEPGMRRAPTQVDDPSRVPPGQRLTPGWPVLHVGAAPTFDPQAWTFTVTGAVDRRVRWDWDDFRSLPTATVTSDFHCVTHWSRLDCTWEGVRARDVLAVAGPRSEATHVVVTGHPAYAANLPLAALMEDDVLFAWAVDGAPLPAAHGGPLRLVVPSRYGWKSVKWAFEVRLVDRDVPGYWEERGYHDNADPWQEQRFR